MKRLALAHWSTWLLALLILLAAALRLARLQILPPGLADDEAINGVDVRMVLSGGGLPVYFLANNGREPLFIYLQALAVALLGYRPYTLRLVAALVGIATVPVIYACGLALIPAPYASDRQRPVLSRLAALLAAAGLAVSYWHLSLSRLGLRAVLLPPLSALMMLAFWHAWTRQRYRFWVLAGVWLALSLYTYTAARLLPLVLVLFLLSEALFDAWRLRRLAPPQRAHLAALWRQRLAGVGLLALTCAVILIPLAIAALREPLILWGRSDQVSIFRAAGQAPMPGRQALGANVLRVARNFYDRGGSDLHFNLPGRPVNDPLLAILFTLGWLAALRWLREPRYRLLLIWFAVMLLPTLLSVDAPHGLRAAGALPPLALLYGAGAAVAVALLRVPAWRVPALAVLTVAVVMGSGALTARDYFVRWASSRRLGAAFDVQYQLAADWASRTLRDQPGRPVLLSYDLYVRPQVVFALGLPDARPPADWPPAALAPGQLPTAVEDGFDPGQPMVLLWGGPAGLQSATLQPLPAATAAALATDHGDLQPVTAPAQRTGWPQIWAGLLALTQPLQPRQLAYPLDVTFANGLHLSGYEVRPDALAPDLADQRFRLTLAWDLGPALQHATMATTEAFVHLAGSRGVQATANGRITGSYLAVWPNVEGTWEDVRDVALAPGTPPGKAFFEVGLDQPSATGGEPERVPVLGPAGEPVADQLDLGAVVIGEGPAQADLSDLQPYRARFGDTIEFVGWQARRAPDDPSVLEVTTGWHALSRPATGYTAFVHLVDGQGQILAQQDAPPGGADDPTSRWVPGESVRSTFRLPLPQSSLPAGAALRVGLYEPASGKRAPVAAAGPVADNALILPLGALP